MRFFADSPVIAVRDVPHEANALRSLRRRGEVWSPLPGIFAHKDTADGWDLRILAAHLWAPSAVVSGAAAAKLSWWTELECDVIELWGPKRKAPAPWVRMQRTEVDADHFKWRGQMKVASPALSVMQLARARGGEAIDEALRRGAATLAQMHDALSVMGSASGVAHLRALLRESRDEPWSPLERRAHALLHGASITGWRSNYPVLLDGHRYAIDIAFPGLRIAIEIDGFKFHSSREAFDNDREKQNRLVLAGWRVLRFTSNSMDKFLEQLLPLLA